MVWADTAREVMGAVVAVPPESVTEPPKTFPSIWNCTVPVGVPAPGDAALMVAVKVTDWPKTEGLTEQVTTVVLLAWFTVCVSVEDALAPKLISPLYTAVKKWVATERVLLVDLDTPVLKAFVASELVPSLNSTVPVG